MGLDHVHHLGKNATEQLSSWMSRSRHSSAWIMTTTWERNATEQLSSWMSMSRHGSAWIMTTTWERTQRNNLVLGCQDPVTFGLDHDHHLGKNATEQLSSWMSMSRHSSAWIMTTTWERTQRNNLVLGCQGPVTVRPGSCPPPGKERNGTA